LVFWHQRVFGVSARDRAPFMAAVGFDAAVWELWPYLAAGASLHLPSDKAIYTVPGSLRDWLVQQESRSVSFPTPLGRADDESGVAAGDGAAHNVDRRGYLAMNILHRSCRFNW